MELITADHFSKHRFDTASRLFDIDCESLLTPAVRSAFVNLFAKRIELAQAERNVFEELSKL